MNDFVTWGALGTYAGMAAVTCALTEVLKKYINLDPKWIALIAAGVLAFGHTLIFLGDYSASGIFMTAVNWLVVTGSSIGIFEGVIKNILSSYKTDKNPPIINGGKNS